MNNQSERNALRDQFLGWQCRIRQHAVRKQEGRPPRGASAACSLDGKFVSQVSTILCKQEPETVTAEFRFMVQRTVDPKKRHESALKFLSEYYYQFPLEFDSRPTALFALDSEVALRLTRASILSLDFFQANQRYLLKCTATSHPPGSPLYEATYWHNHLFNPNMPGVVNVLAFDVDWGASGFEQIPI